MALAITSINPATGPATGGNAVTIVGTDLDLVDEVIVGNEVARIASQTAVQIVFIAPAHAAGNATVHVVDNDANQEVAAATPYVYTVAATPEQLVSTGARKWRLQVDASLAMDGSQFIDVRGMQDFAPSAPPTMQDDTDYDGEGWGSKVKTLLNWSNVVKVGRKKGLTSGNYDPGQQILWTAHDQFGADGLVLVRWFDRDGGPEAYQGFANVQWDEPGGDATALSVVTVTLDGSGARLKIVNPAA